MAVSKSRKNLVRKGRNGGSLKSGNTVNVGRPRKLLGSINEELSSQGFQPIRGAELSQAFQIILNLDEESVSQIANDKSNPMFLRIVSSKLLNEDESYSVLQDILDRLIGRPKNSLNLSAGDEAQIPILNIPQRLTIEEWEKRYGKSEKINHVESPRQEIKTEKPRQEPQPVPEKTQPTAYILGE